jgi:hypothetical protein
MYDGYFYVTPRNYTWQLQCTTNYEGDILSVGDTANFSKCINACIDHNRATAPGVCLAVTFNGPNDGAVGSCTLWSDIFNTLLAYEEGSKHLPIPQIHNTAQGYRVLALSLNLFRSLLQEVVQRKIVFPG